MTKTETVCLVGHVLIDVTFSGRGQAPTMRLGGIAHAARALWALENPYTLAYYAPTYLEEQVRTFASHYGTTECYKIGTVIGCPNVIIVAEPTESGPQGYELLLRDELRTIQDNATLKTICKDHGFTDFLVFPGGFDLKTILEFMRSSEADVFVDASYEPDDPEIFALLGRRISGIMMSTSSDIFRKRYNSDVHNLCECLLEHYADAVLFKENRGGSRFFTNVNGLNTINTPAQVRPICHSVGVGDCHDAVYIVLRRKMETKAALAYSAHIATEYASTTDPEDFRAAVQATLEIPETDILEIQGVTLPWEIRPKYQIYIAAPDFKRLDRTPIERLVESLEHHNFVPRRPVVEYGEMEVDANADRKQRLCDADLSLLDSCAIMVAVLLFDDPGTLIEIGIAIQRRMPVIVYDPYSRGENLMLTQLPNLVSSNLDEVIAAVFRLVALESQK